MSDSKILLTYLDDEGTFKIERVWATKEGSYYRINNIPFFATSLALNDLVSVEEDDGAFYFDKLIEPSGHSAIQLIIFNENDVLEIGKDLENFGRTSEGSNINTMISVDIPKEISYASVKAYLENGEKEGRWSYKEASLSHKY